MVAARGRTISFGGMVTEAEHKIGKNGRPWGGMTVEDYHGSQRMMFWRDDYLKFRDYMVSGWFLFIKGKVQMKQFRGADELEFKVTRIELLSDVLEKMAGRLRVQVNLAKWTADWSEQVCALIESNKGGVGVTVELHHPRPCWKCHLGESAWHCSSDLLEGLEAMEG